MRYFVALLVMSLVPASFAEDAKPVALFDGKSLDGWKIIGCQAEVQDGAILIKEGNGVVRPDRKFADYTLTLEWKALKDDNWDSGIYVRCIDPDGKYPWPRKWQINLRKGLEGNMNELKAASKGLAKDKEWNSLKFTVIGSKAELEINGKSAWKADGITDAEGFISLQAEVPGGGQYLFRNIMVVEHKK